MIYAATGHRPSSLGGFAPEAARRLADFATDVLSKLRATSVITGMALGWDQAVARACIRLGIPFCAAVPCDDHDSEWSPVQRESYGKMLMRAYRVHVVSPGTYAAWKMHARNEFMVDSCDRVLALWNGIRKGGTFGCVTYAEKVKRPVKNVWDEWRVWSDAA